MEETIKIVLMVVVLMPMMMGNEDLGIIVNQMRMEMKTMRKDLIATEKDLLTTKKELLTTKIDVNKRLDAKEGVIQELKGEIYFLKNAPRSFACGAHYNSLSISTQVIPYTTLLYSSSNVVGDGLDISSGIFSAGYPGTYTVTWSLRAVDNVGDGYLYIFLRKNRERIEESLHSSHYTGPSGYSDDQGGRTLIVHLDRGDTLDLYCYDCSSGIDVVTFCVSLSQGDPE